MFARLKDGIRKQIHDTQESRKEWKTLNLSVKLMDEIEAGNLRAVHRIVSKYKTEQAEGGEGSISQNGWKKIFTHGLFWAAYYGKNEAANILLSNLSASDIDVNHYERYRYVQMPDKLIDEFSPLIAATIGGNTDIVKALCVREEINGDARTFDCRTPLMFAVYHCPAVVPALLATVGTKINAQDWVLPYWAQYPRHGLPASIGSGNTALHHAIIANRNNAGEVPEVITDLLAAPGINLELANSEGFTPLMLAAKSGRLKIARALLDAGASTSGPTIGGATPLSVAKSNDSYHMVKLIEEYQQERNRKEAAERPFRLFWFLCDQRPKPVRTESQPEISRPGLGGL